MENLIKVTDQYFGYNVNAVRARDLYEALELDSSHYARWARSIVDNDYYVENEDFILIAIDGEMKKQYNLPNRVKDDLILTLDVAKHEAMVSKSKAGYKIRQYFIEVEKAFRIVTLKLDSKKRQIEAMEFLSNMLPESLKKEKVNFIKANVIVNKAVSNLFGFPKVLKKSEMSDDMIKSRDKILDDYIKLFEVLQSNSKVKGILYDKYSKK